MNWMLSSIIDVSGVIYVKQGSAGNGESENNPTGNLTYALEKAVYNTTIVLMFNTFLTHLFIHEAYLST